MTTAIEIEKLCSDWYAAATSPDGGVILNDNSERFRLLANGVSFHELDHTALCAAVVGLTKVLLRPGLGVIIDADHHALWAWCGELLLGARANIFPPSQQEIASLYAAAIHAALAGCHKPPASEAEWRKQVRRSKFQAHHAKLLVQEATLVLSQLSFPLLEAVLKRACFTHVTFDGKVISEFTVPNGQGGERVYSPTRQRRQCSSLRDLLHLYYATADPKLVRDLNEIISHLSVVVSSEEPFDLIYRWRNQSLHGATTMETIGGTMLSLALLISLFELRDDFEQRRYQAIKHCRMEVRLGHRSAWSFYPPY